MLCPTAINETGGGPTARSEDSGIRSPCFGAVVDTKCPTPTQSMEGINGRSHSNKGHMSECHHSSSNQMALQFTEHTCLRTKAPMDKYEDSNMEDVGGEISQNAVAERSPKGLNLRKALALARASGGEVIS